MIAALPVNIKSKSFLPCDDIRNASILQQTNKPHTKQTIKETNTIQWPTNLHCHAQQI